MKALYPTTPLNNRRRFAPFSGNTTSKASLMGVSFGHRTPPKMSHRLDLRKQSHSIEHLPASKVIENAQDGYIPRLFHKNSEELFALSYAKICKIRTSIRNKNIDSQINSVLAVLDEEKERVRQRIEKLKKTNEYYRQIYEGTGRVKNTIQTAINTQPVSTSEGQVQTDPDDHEQSTEERNIDNEKLRQVHGKLKGMLIDMNIDPLQILPQVQEDQPKLQQAFKNLSPAEVIRIQKFFMRKLAQKLPK